MGLKLRRTRRDSVRNLISTQASFRVGDDPWKWGPKENFFEFLKCFLSLNESSFLQKEKEELFKKIALTLGGEVAAKFIPVQDGKVLILRRDLVPKDHTYCDARVFSELSAIWFGILDFAKENDWLDYSALFRFDLDFSKTHFQIEVCESDPLISRALEDYFLGNEWRS